MIIKPKKKHKKPKILGPKPKSPKEEVYFEKMAKDLKLEGNIEISTKETWFSKAMDSLKETK